MQGFALLPNDQCYQNPLIGSIGASPKLQPCRLRCDLSAAQELKADELLEENAEVKSPEPTQFDSGKS